MIIAKICNVSKVLSDALTEVHDINFSTYFENCWIYNLATDELNLWSRFKLTFQIQAIIIRIFCFDLL